MRHHARSLPFVQGELGGVKAEHWKHLRHCNHGVHAPDDSISCGWRNLTSAVKTGTWSALRLDVAFPPLCRHEGLAHPGRPSADNSRKASWTWRNQGRGCRQPADEAAAPGHESVSETCTESVRPGSDCSASGRCSSPHVVSREQPS